MDLLNTVGLEKRKTRSEDASQSASMRESTYAELNVGREEVDALVLVERAVDESRLNDALLALGSAEEGLSHAGTGHSHAEGGRASTVLGLDDLVATELDAVDQLGVGG